MPPHAAPERCSRPDLAGVGNETFAHRTFRSPPSRRLRSAAGQASVELVAALPAIVVILAVAWQAVLAGQAVWHARVAARAAARAHSFGADAERAARDHLPRRLERGLRVTTRASGDVRVS